MDDSSTNLHRQAIQAALSSNWEEALKINQQILGVEPKCVEAMNRLARSYFELGDMTLSQKNFQDALEIDPYNQIAAKFLKRIETFSKRSLRSDDLKKGGRSHVSTGQIFDQIDSDLFIEEPGKTKLVTLLKVAEPQKLSLMSAGALVSLVIKNRGISVIDRDGGYLGVLPDDLSHHLIRLINGGNKYQAIIKTIKVNSLSILLREVFRAARFKNQPSFLDSTNVSFAYSSDHIIVPSDSEDEPMMEAFEEEMS